MENPHYSRLHSETPIPMEALFFKMGDTPMETKLGYSCTSEVAASIGAQGAHIVLVADMRVYQIWGAELLAELERHARVAVVQIDAIETGKKLDIVQSILDQAVAAGATRRSVIVSFGGGLIGNVAGVVAGLLFRGLPLAHIPTTLLAMSDSVLSQKQAVNGVMSKNMYGLYHPARLTCIDVKYLHSLPSTEFSAGIVELCKNSLAFDFDTLAPLRELLVDTIDPAAWIQLIRMGISSKQRLLLNDPFENREGLALEYGHTVGHALELETGMLPHGHAVGLGMLIAAAIAQDRDWLSFNDVIKHIELISMAGAPLILPCAVSERALIRRLKGDNKRGRIPLRTEQYAFVLLEKLGKPACTGEQVLVAVDEEEILRAFHRLSAGEFVQHVDAA